MEIFILQENQNHRSRLKINIGLMERIKYIISKASLFLCKKYVPAINVILLLLFITSLYGTIYYSNLPLLIDNEMTRRLFAYKSNDGALCGIATGYFTGYVVYCLTVLMPSHIRRKPYIEETDKTIYKVMQVYVRTLLLIVKSLSTNNEWNVYFANKSDAECFHSMFFEKMKDFKLDDEAYTVILNNRNGSKITWAKYLTIYYTAGYEAIRELKSRCYEYIDWETALLINEILDDKYLSFFAKDSTEIRNEVYDKNGFAYFDDVACADFCDFSKFKPFFADETNMKLLISHIKVISDIEKYLRNRKTISYKSDYYVKWLSNDMHGRFK